MPPRFATPSQGSLRSLKNPPVSKRRRLLALEEPVEARLGRLDLTDVSKDPISVFDEDEGEFVTDDGLVAEISASVWIGNKQFTLSSGGSDTLTLSNWSDPSSPQLVSQLVLEDSFTTSVASYGNLFAVAATPDAYDEATNGAALPKSQIIFFSINPGGQLKEIDRVETGFLADGIAFSKDGTQLYVANEGQPSSDYSVDPIGSVMVIDISGQGGTLSFEATEVTLSELDPDEVELLGSGIRFEGPLEVTTSFAQDAEPEYVAAAGRYLFATLQESNTVARIDLDTNTVEAYIGLGWVDYSQVSVDLDDKDGGFDPKDGQDVVGLRMPDGMAAWEQGDDIFFITANEGDAREYETKDGDVYLDEIRNKDLQVEYNTVPGRLKLITSEVYLESEEATAGQNILVLNDDNLADDPTNDFISEGNPSAGDRIDTPVSFGSRSLSIFNGMSGELVWDSWMRDAIDGTDYNTSLQNIAEFADIYDDGRSDDKGVEPESVVIVNYEDSIYAVASLERTDAGDKNIDPVTGEILDTSAVEQGGLLVIYDVTDTTDVDFITYQQVSRAPEGLEVIEAPQSPTGRLLLGVSSEFDSNSVEFLDFAAILENGNGADYLASALANPEDYLTLANPNS